MTINDTVYFWNFHSIPSIFMCVLMPGMHCLDKCSFAVSLKIGSVAMQTFLFLFMIVLSPLHFQVIFRISLSIISFYLLIYLSLISIYLLKCSTIFYYFIKKKWNFLQEVGDSFLFFEQGEMGQLMFSELLYYSLWMQLVRTGFTLY